MSGYSDSAIVRYERAMWYAWGQLDAGVGAEASMGTLSGLRFAVEQREAHEDYATGRRHDLRSIQAEWREFCAKKGVTLP